MQYRRLGRAGIKVSAVSLGSWLTYGGTVGIDDARACVRAALDAGVNHFDAADAYQGGAAEEVLRQALEGVERSAVVLATKVYWPTGPGPNDRGTSRKHLTESLHRSLRRLGTDYVDILYCHRFDEETDLEETLFALNDLVQQGKVLYAGVSEWPAYRIKEAREIQRRLHLRALAASQPQYNLLSRGIEREVLPVCREEGLGIIAFSPLAQGLLTGKYRPGAPAPEGSRGARNERIVREDALHRIERLRPLAAEAGVTMGQLALAWVLRLPEISAALIGASTPEQVRENVRAAEWHIPSDLATAVEQALDRA
jgi:aryl-alcohol dehydrogenase-like predicted oxidoreductase